MDTRIIKCDRCSANIRVPRNRGQLKVICPLCKYEFLFNSGPIVTYGARGPATPGAAAPRPARRPAKKRSGLGGILAVLVLLLAASAVFFFSQNKENSPASTPPVINQPPSAAISLVSTPPDISQPPTAAISLAPMSSAYDRASDLIPYFELRYFLSRLSEADLDVVCTIYESAMNFEDQCTFEGKVKLDQVKKLINLLEMECPELFQLDRQNSLLYYDRSTNGVTSYDLKYQYDQNKYESMRSSCEAVINGFVAQTAGLSDYEKEKYVFDYIASNCWYNADAVYAGNPYGALVSFEAKCDGFSGAMKWSMEALGVQCLNISGAPLEGEIGHAWNIINLDGSYYRLDVTPSVNEEWKVDQNIDVIIYKAFNVIDALNTDYVIRDFFDGFAPIPPCNSMKASYYARTGHFVPAGTDPTPVLSKEVETLAANGGGLACVQFESIADYEAFCNGAGKQLVEDLLNNCGKRWNGYTWWEMNYNVYAFRVNW